MTSEQVEELLERLEEKVADCSAVTRDNKRCCKCFGCGQWIMMMEFRDEIDGCFGAEDIF